jgi:hypothetical protein
MKDGRVYLVAGKSFSGIFELTGLDTIRRLPEQKLNVTAEDVAAARRYLDRRPRGRADASAEPGQEVPDKATKPLPRHSARGIPLP